MPFTFSDTATTDDNIESFLKHLEMIDKELAQILRVRVALMQPFSTDAQARSAKRVTFNTAVRADVDALKQ